MCRANGDSGRPCRLQRKENGTMKKRLEQNSTTAYMIRYLSADGMIPSLRMGEVRPETEAVNMLSRGRLSENLK